MRNKKAEKKYVPPMPTWKIIWRVICFKKKIFVINLIAMISINLIAQAPGLIMREFFNKLANHSTAGFSVLTLVAFLFAAEVSRLTGVLVIARTNVPFFVYVMTLLRKNMLSYILKRPGASALPDSPGEAISRFRGDVAEIPVFALWMNDLFGTIVFSIIALTVMFRINPSITILSVIPFIVVGVIANLTTKKIVFYRRANRRAAGIVCGFIAEMFGAVQAVKVATAEKSVLKHFRKLTDDFRKIAIKDRLFNEILRSIFVNATNVGTGIILILAGKAMSAKTFTVGDFALFVYYLDFISELMTFSGLLVARYRQLGVSAERMHRLMNGSSPEALVEVGPVYLDGELPEVVYESKSDDSSLHKLKVSNLCFTYPNTDNGIKDIDFCLKKGTFTVVTGRNGCGKTTMLRVLLGLLSKDKGNIYWNDEEVEKPAEFFVPPISAYTSQVPRLFSDSLRDNILMGMEAEDNIVAEAIESAVMEHDLDRLDYGLETMVGPKGIKLSGGQMQRTAAARMFVRNPELLVFDDLSSALDVETERLLWERVFEKPDTTCLIVSHRRAALSLADKIIVMKDGKIEAQGKLEELLETCEEMQNLWNGEVIK